jgi:formylglycine-generating enzyme required for sulfatase activity
MTDAGAYSLSASPYGTFDQGGNVWEWNETTLCCSGNQRDYRGGDWLNQAPAMKANGNLGGLPSGEGPTLGFRVATVPEPSSFVLAGAFLALLVACRSSQVDGMP